jgi:hypothetical protein
MSLSFSGLCATSEADTSSPEVVVNTKSAHDGQKLELNLRQLVQEELQKAMVEQTKAMVAIITDAGFSKGTTQAQQEALESVARSSVPQPAAPAAVQQADKKEEPEVFEDGQAADGDAEHMPPAPLTDQERKITQGLMNDSERAVRSMSVAAKAHENELYDPVGTKAEERQTVAEILIEHAPLCAGCIKCAEWCYNHMGTFEAAELGDPISKLVDSTVFATIVNGVIFLNCIFMWVSADEELSRAHQNGDIPSADFVVYGELAFMIAYSVEFVCKLIRFRAGYFVGPEWKYNWLDFFLLFLSYFFHFSDTGNNLGFLRTVRILKLAKALRVFRLVATFKSLRAILISLINTLGTLGWSILMLAVIHFLFGLVIVLRVAQFLGTAKDEAEENGYPPHTLDHLDGSVDVENLMFWFGDVFKAMRALYGTSSGGEGWQTFFDLLLPTSWVNSAFMLFFVFFSQIAILNIILGIFVDDAMKSMQSSKEEAIFEYADAEAEIADNIRQLCNEADASQTGTISKKEWVDAIRKGSMQAYLDLIGLRMHNVMEFFNALAAQHNGQVDIDEFVKGCMRMKGSASAFDMQVLMAKVDELKDK